MRAQVFSLPDQNGIVRNLQDFSGSWIILYFYPKDDTPGCTKEACNFRDRIKDLTEKGVVVMGISKDTVESHKKFTDKYKLNFYLLSDETKKTIQSYGAWGEKKFMGKKFEGVIRKTFLIDPKGEIQKVYEKVNPLFHADEIMKDLAQLM